MMEDYFVRKLDTSCSGDNGTKTLRQLHTEEDDEERFQADLEKAVRQSLGKCFLTLSSIHLFILMLLNFYQVMFC